MKRALLGLVFLATLAIIAIPNQGTTPGDRYAQPDSLNPGNMKTASAEIRHNRTIMKQDLQKTELLSREQCVLHINHMLSGANRRTPSDMKTAMDNFRKRYAHMELLEWRRDGSKISSGSIDAKAYQEAKDELKKAANSANAGKQYVSRPFQVKGQTYFVLGVPSPTPSSYVTGIVHQDLLDQIKLQQVKNLRIAPFPSEGRYRIESADSVTLEDVTVDHPEQNEGTSHYHMNQVVVKFRQSPTNADLKQIQKEIACVRMKKLGYTYVFESRRMDAKQLMRYFQERWNPQYVEPHFLYMTNEAESAAPNDTLYAKYQWNLPIIGTNEGWGLSKGNEETIVAVVDTGVDLEHPDLKGRLLPGYNVFDKSNVPSDDVGHGTHVSGIISASVNNSEGVAGMTWFNKILPVKVLDQSGAGSTYAVAEGIIWAADHGAKVINMSLGNYAEAEFLHDAIRYAYDKDIVLIAASGNDNTERPGYPAAYPEVFAVAATDSNSRKAAFSNYGAYIDVAAPGVNIPSTYTGGQYAALSGTSMASPHVAALAGLIRSMNPELTNVQIMELMRKSATDLGAAGHDADFGWGQIDVPRALQAASQNQYSIQFWPQQLERKLAAIERKYIQ
ncbi:serine protease [Paenibacillus swuensis]|uniref:Serine protease n=1 Tax=Paenibacillus swuensis TaxID=1178515 RepID=A0A172TK90_9BACL|nr:S8 family peptidase [Paenibacillus swuensis]ANE47334.1 serine protease [Paenibacillus swuensis]